MRFILCAVAIIVPLAVVTTCFWMLLIAAGIIAASIGTLEFLWNWAVYGWRW